MSCIHIFILSIIIPSSCVWGADVTTPLLATRRQESSQSCIRRNRGALRLMAIFCGMGCALYAAQQARLISPIPLSWSSGRGSGCNSTVVGWSDSKNGSFPEAQGALQLPRELSFRVNPIECDRLQVYDEHIEKSCARIKQPSAQHMLTPLQRLQEKIKTLKASRTRRAVHNKPLMAMPSLPQEVVAVTQPSISSTLTKLSETDRTILYADTQRTNHRVIVSKGSYVNISYAYAQICFAAQEIPSDFSLFIDPKTDPQECSVCEKNGLQCNAPHAHVAMGHGSRPMPVDDTCVFCGIIGGKCEPGTCRNGDIISSSKNAVLFTKGKGSHIINNCLAVPKPHIVNIKDMTEYDIPIVADIFTLTKETMTKHHGLPYVLLTNNGPKAPYHQTVPHMHFHIDSPDSCRFSLDNLDG